MCDRHPHDPNFCAVRRFVLYSPIMEPLVRCGGCSKTPTDGPLRRGRCAKCYDRWVKSRAVGVGASCAACDDRRHVHLRYWEIGVRGNAPGGRWVVLCHNCVAAAEAMDPQPRSIDGLKMRLARDRRWGDRRAESVGRQTPRNPAFERRAGERRRDHLSDEAALDAVVIEMEAEFEEVTDDQIEASEEITGIHFRIPLPE
jgi:hypothetical protein